MSLEPSPAQDTCPDENLLAQYAENLLDQDAAGAVSAHLVGCAACRAVLAGALRATSAVREPAMEAGAPLDLLHQLLSEEAPARERVASAFVFAAAGVSLFAFALVHLFVRPIDPRMMGALATPLLYAAAVQAALRRGWYRPWLPFAATLFEASCAGGILLVVSHLYGGEVVAQSPALLLWSALLVFSAFRADPRLSLAAGALAAAQSLLLWWVAPPAAVQGVPSLARAAIRSSFLLLSGMGGALLARYLVRRAEEALRLVRERDLMGKYVLHERLGMGGMAEVFRATYCPEGGFRKAVAIKRVLPHWSGDDRFGLAFREEARLGAMLSHPNVVQVLDCGRYRDSFIVAMEYVDGQSLAAILLRQRTLPVNAVAYLGAELCAALDYIHRREDAGGHQLRLVHRDVNPPNILVSRIGEVKLSDFGVASATSRSAIGERDGFYGKELYAAPEQLQRGPIDARTDLFGLGLTLHRALSGELPPQGQSLRAARPEAPAELVELVERLLARDPGGRPASAAEARAQLLSLTGEAAPYPSGRTALTHCVAASS